MKRYDYIIVGFGLAGATLALTLLQRKRTVLVFNRPELTRSSAVAAGLFNPITGKAMDKTWKADQLFPFLNSWYLHAEKYLNEKFFFPRPIYRPFLSAGEQNDWITRADRSDINPYIRNLYTQPICESQVKNPLGGLLLDHCGFVDVAKYILAITRKLESLDGNKSGEFEPGKLLIKDDEVEYESFRARKIIFCEGINVAQNPFFSWLPIKPLKGEVIKVELSDKPEHIYNRGVYVVPDSGDTFRVGATYNKNKTPGTTAEGRSELTEKLDELLAMKYEILNQDWGIRPTVSDRRPILGAHPYQENLVIFNGLGTKGVSLAPYFANQLAAWLEGHGDLESEVNITRYKSLYSKF